MLAYKSVADIENGQFKRLLIALELSSEDLEDHDLLQFKMLLSSIESSKDIDKSIEYIVELLTLASSSNTLCIRTDVFEIILGIAGSLDLESQMLPLKFFYEFTLQSKAKLNEEVQHSFFTYLSEIFYQEDLTKYTSLILAIYGNICINLKYSPMFIIPKLLIYAFALIKAFPEQMILHVLRFLTSLMARVDILLASETIPIEFIIKIMKFGLAQTADDDIHNESLSLLRMIIGKAASYPSLIQSLNSLNFPKILNSILDNTPPEIWLPILVNLTALEDTNICNYVLDVILDIKIRINDPPNALIELLDVHINIINSGDDELIIRVCASKCFNKLLSSIYDLPFKVRVALIHVLADVFNGESLEAILSLLKNESVYMFIIEELFNDIADTKNDCIKVLSNILMFASTFGIYLRNDESYQYLFNKEMIQDIIIHMTKDESEIIHFYEFAGSFFQYD